MVLYIIYSKSSNRFYIGITKNLQRRKASHKYFSKHKHYLLYVWMRKYEDWDIVTACEYETKEEATQDEIFWIEFGRNNNWPLLNLAIGGETGYSIPEEKKPAWKEKLRKSRAGKKPALGMKHSDENKKYFSQVSKEYWKTQDTYKAEEVCKHSFREAHKLYGISKTHYYRLKRTLASD